MSLPSYYAAARRIRVHAERVVAEGVRHEGMSFDPDLTAKNHVGSEVFPEWEPLPIQTTIRIPLEEAGY